MSAAYAGTYYRLQADDGGPGGAGIRPHWNRLGSAVCPEGYDYYAWAAACHSASEGKART